MNAKIWHIVQKPCNIGPKLTNSEFSVNLVRWSFIWTHQQKIRPKIVFALYLHINSNAVKHSNTLIKINALNFSAFFNLLASNYSKTINFLHNTKVISVSRCKNEQEFFFFYDYYGDYSSWLLQRTWLQSCIMHFPWNKVDHKFEHHLHFINTIIKFKEKR